MTIRVSVTDWIPGRLDLEQTVAFAQALERLGCDAIHVSSGGNGLAQNIPVGPSYQLPLARAVKTAVGIPIVAVGLITAFEQTETIVATGDADMIALARRILYDFDGPGMRPRHREPEFAFLSNISGLNQGDSRICSRGSEVSSNSCMRMVVKPKNARQDLKYVFSFGFLLGSRVPRTKHPALAESIIAFLLICIGVQIAWHGVHALMTTNRWETPVPQDLRRVPQRWNGKASDIFSRYARGSAPTSIIPNA